MNAKVLSLLSCLTLVLPAGAVFAGSGHHGSSVSRGGGGARSAPQARSTFRGSGAGFQRSNFRGYSPAFQRSNYASQRSNSAWRTNNRINTVSRSNRVGLSANRAAINGRNWNRFGNGTNRFSSNWNGSNRFRNGSGFNNHNGNWWRHHHHHDNSFIFFGGFGYPFFWDYGYYPYEYYPYYPASYSYDPYGYSNSGYPVYSDNGYTDESGYTDDQSGRYGDTRRYARGGNLGHSIVSRVQEQLAQAGYYKGTIDGVQGSRTFYAIRSYQRDHNLPVTGRIDSQLLSEMGLGEQTR